MSDVIHSGFAHSSFGRSDFTRGARRLRANAAGKSFESRAMFAACFVLFLIRATFKRMMPWRAQGFLRREPGHESIFSEASTAASVCVASAFMGL